MTSRGGFMVGIEEPRVIRTGTAGRILMEWPQRIADCKHERKLFCMDDCARGCGWVGGVVGFCLAHFHCGCCQATQCHSFWWRPRKPPRIIETSMVETAANPKRITL